jgi:ATP-dependent DNA helicase RecG
MNITQLEELLGTLRAEKTELQWLEFKSNIFNQGASITPEAIGEYISALSNGACIANKDFGYLILGIENITHKIVGTNFRASSQQQGNQVFELWLRNLVTPKINFQIYEFDLEDKHLALFKIPSAKGEPTCFKGEAWIRIDSSKTKLKNYPNLIRQIYNSQEDWSAQIIENASLADLDEEAINLARSKFKEKNINASFYNQIDDWDTATFLDRAKITIDKNITRTALILLGKSESSHFLLPALAEITWKLDAGEQAYEHFAPPLLLNTSKILQYIRNIRYKIFPDNKLFATEVNKYETRVILEALHNAIAHQDYHLNSRVIVEEKIDKLIFTNAGSFFLGKPDDYALGEKTPEKYRNPWLTKAMVNLNMIDTVGYGIHTMFEEQRKRYFPLPDYSRSTNDKVVLEIYGHLIDENYSKLLIEKRDLDLTTVILLDRVQKKLDLTKDAIALLRSKKLIEGRAPNIYISAHIAQVIDDQVQYIKNRGFDDKYFKDLIISYIKKFGAAKKGDLENLLLSKLPETLSDKQKKNKIRNLVHSLSKKEGLIINSGTSRNPLWILADHESLSS